MTDIKKEIIVGKEITEATEAIAELIKAYKKGGIAAMHTAFEAVAKGIDGCGQIPDEVKAKSIYMSGSYSTGIILEALVS